MKFMDNHLSYISFYNLETFNENYFVFLYILIFLFVFFSFHFGMILQVAKKDKIN